MKELTQQVVNWTKETFDKLGKTDMVLGISGGKDSSVVAAIGVAALGKEHVHGVLLPCGIQKDISCSYKLVDHLGIDYDVQDIETLVKESLALVPGADKSYDAKTNVGARIRTNQIMVTAQTHGWLMANTCQRNEDVVGYATLWGDSVGSFSPLGMLTVSEVIEIGDDLGLPYELTHKTPIDGLQPLTDEEKLGFTYKELSDLIRFGIKGEHYDLIMQKFNANRFKLELIRLPKFDPHLPDYFKDNFGI
ncbi:MAG: NAD(+) synthase [Methanobrevibacter sp.]|nr:NAD(+) synthase [Methanobrevibacter sp.]MBR0371815.1 NAD(+) synthase [Methanobrevibacter sp.]